MSKVEAKQAIGAAIKAGLDATDGEWQSDRVKRETAIRTALSHLGFTREDVGRIRDLARSIEIAETVQELLVNFYALRDAEPALRAIADRIEVLLPAENGWTVVKPADGASGSAGGSFSATSPTEDQSK